MSLAFRNIDITPDDPVAQWHNEGIQAALERGDLSDWRKIASEVARAPWGQVAQELEEVLTYARPYGVADLMEDVVRTARTRVEQAERDEVAMEIRHIVETSGLNGQEFARQIGTSASRLSTYIHGRVVPSATLLVRMRQVAQTSKENHP